MSAKVAQSKRFVLSFVFILCAWLCISALPVRAQIGNATLSGAVTDASGGVIADAELTLTSQATGFEQRATSNERGEYTFRNLTPGNYDLKVTKPGFENYVQTHIVLTINQSGHADASLKVGATNETVRVEGENTLINFDNGTLQGGIDPDTLKELPLSFAGKPRSSASFAVLLPGVSTGSSSEAFNARINGGIQSGDEALLDGATMQEGFMSQSGMVAIQGDFQMSPDMVQEVKVLTSSYDAQYGSSTSGQITMVSKSGTSQYHGAAFEYARNKAMNAAPWGTTCPTSNPGCDRRPLDNEHNFGANVGGPIKIPFLYHGTSKHHSFFYFDWESFHQAGGSNTPTLTIPSLKERAGDFTDWLDSNGKNKPIYVPGNFRSQASPACLSALGGLGPGQQFPGNIIPSACISPIAKAYLDQLPQPTNSQAQDNYRLPRPVPDTLVGNSNVYMTRIDHNYGDKDHFYFFWWRQFTGYNLATALPMAIATESPTRPQNSPIARFNWEHTFSSTLTNHATFGYLNRNEGYGSVNLTFVGKLPQIAGAASTNALPQFTFSDKFNQLSNSTGIPGGNVTTRPTWVFNDLVSKVFGHHTFTFGGEWRAVQGNIHQKTNESGTYDFGRANTSLSGGDTGSPVAGFLLGAVSGGSMDRRTVSAWYPRQTVWAFHGNDSWKITPKLTVNYGLRWDYYSPSREKFNHLSFLDPLGANPSAGGLPGRLAFAGSGASCGSACFGRNFPEDTWKKGFAPRFGVAYAWDSKTVVRAGYGVFFAQAFYPGWGGGMSLDGFNLNQAFGTTQDPTTRQTDPFFYLDGGVPAPPQAPPFVSPAYDNGRSPLYRPVDANRRSYAQQWNLTIERQLPYSVFLSVAYVANKGTRLPSSLQPINVLNPFDAKIRALEAPLDPNCGINSPNPANPVGCVPQLSDKFVPGGPTTLHGVSAPYSGWVTQLNGAGACSPTVAQALLPYPQFCSNLQGLNENHGSSIYHSFQLKAEKRYSQGLYMLVAYTNSKLITDAADNTQRGGGGVWNGTQGVISPFEKSRNRAVAPDDVPQVLSAAFVYDLPFGKGKRFANQGGVVNAVVGGWQISPIFRFSRGTLMWVRSGSCQVMGSFAQGCLVGLVPGVNPFLQDPNSFDPGKGPLLNIAAFEPLGNFKWVNPNAAPGTPGGFGYVGTGPRVSNMRGPNYKIVDLGLGKTVKIGERGTFLFHVGVHNLLNNHIFVDDGNFNQSGNFAFNNDINNGNFGTWTGAVSSPRSLQLGARIEL